mmetsp:Transcript_4072/g.9235  ORF Transcript_4072/g.9235 Transcript_4072/m.9235 type:complete len:272 (+) Transcript_4072:195-1010(+)
MYNKPRQKTAQSPMLFALHALPHFIVSCHLIYSQSTKTPLLSPLLLGTILHQTRIRQRRGIFTLFAHSLALTLFLPLSTRTSSHILRHLQPKTQRAKPLHQHLALIRRNRRNIHRPLWKNQRETLVGIGRLALLSQYRRPRKHWIVRVRAPRMPHFLAARQIQLWRTLPRRRFPQRRFPRQGPPVRMDVQHAQAGFAPPRSPVLDHRDPRAEAGDEAADYKVRGVGASRGGFEVGRLHWYVYRSYECFCSFGNDGFSSAAACGVEGQGVEG